MKSLDGGEKKNAENNAAQAGEKCCPEEGTTCCCNEEPIDFSNVVIEPLFEDFVDFETFSKSDFRAVKVKDCVAVKKSNKLLSAINKCGEEEELHLLMVDNHIPAGAKLY